MLPCTLLPLWPCSQPLRGMAPSASSPGHLTGEYPGDYGWDAAGLAAGPTTFAAYRGAELIHACWAMLGTLGCLNPELLAKYACVQIDAPVWFQAGAHILPEGGLGALWELQPGARPVVPRCRGLPVFSSSSFFFALMGAFEACR